MHGFFEEPQVMIIDDILACRTVVRDMLAEMGITRVVEASDGQEALVQLQRHRAQLIICDLVMDEMHGASLLSLVRKHATLHNIPFVMMSSCSEEPVIRAALKMGARDFLVKPLSFKIFKERIFALLRESARAW